MLKNDHDKLAKGETSGRFPLLDELHKRLPKTPGAFGPEQLCRLVELKDDAEPWRRAMELFLGNNRFAILLDPQRHRLAQRLLRDLELATNREPLVDHDEALKLEARPHPDSLAAKLEAKNSVARCYLDHLLGNVICVDSPDDFPGKTRAITQDAILWRRPAPGFRFVKGRTVRAVFISKILGPRGDRAGTANPESFFEIFNSFHFSLELRKIRLGLCEGMHSILPSCML